MSAVAAPAIQPSLASEWARIELLAHSLGLERQGQRLSDDLLEQLKELQTEVEQLRRHVPKGAWGVLASSDGVPIDGNPMVFDLLALVLGPEVEPRLGWMYQQLQPGLPQAYPSPALVRELLALDNAETVELYSLLDEQAPLRRSGLLRMESFDLYQPIFPGAGVAARLMGWPQIRQAPAGTQRVKAQTVWEDLILPADRLQQLHEFLYWIQQRKTVVDDWGGSVSGGPVALFTGPSGTGKTFAATVLANALGWPLYRVDLGSLVSKYIGETEKNLNQLFDAAHGQEMVLLFDEADSLFSKRGDVKDARDRYANMEVSHLLSRIEAHQGPVILTTNLRQHLDTAFSRRFQIVVDFPRPDVKARTGLWARALPPRAPHEPELDPVFLGQALSMTGGSIRNAALHAAYVAAGTGQPLGLQQVALAVWRELAKDGREVNRTDLGGLAQWLPEDLCL